MSTNQLLRKLKKPPKVEIYKHEEEWRWRITAKNGKIIGASSEGYKNKADCISNIKDVADAITNEIALAGKQISN